MDSSDVWAGPATDPDTYRLVSVLGGGGEGEVWLAELALSDQVRSRVAVKILPAAEDDEQAQQWVQQGHLLRQLASPGLVHVLDVFTGPRPHRAGRADPASVNRYVVMKHVEGPTLLRWIEEHPQASVSERIGLVRTPAHAVDELHRGRIASVPVAHGDIKPGNIVVDADGRAVLVDVGLTQLAGGRGIPGLTLPFAAPELRTNGGVATPATDRYAFAATLVQLLTDQVPRVGPDGFPDYAAIRDQLLTHPRTAGRTELVDAVLRALDPDPDQRPATLAGWLGGVGQATTSTALRQPAPRPAPATAPAPAPDSGPTPPPVRPVPLPGPEAPTALVATPAAPRDVTTGGTPFLPPGPPRPPAGHPGGPQQPASGGGFLRSRAAIYAGAVLAAVAVVVGAWLWTWPGRQSGPVALLPDAPAGSSSGAPSAPSSQASSASPSASSTLDAASADATYVGQTSRAPAGGGTTALPPTTRTTATTATTTEPARPGAVGSMSVTSTGTTTLKVSWSAAANATRYRLGWTDTGTGETWDGSSPDYAASQSPVTLISLKPGHTYSVRVTPYSAVADGPTTTRTATTDDAPATPGGVGSMSATATSSTTIRLSWSAATGATRYRLGWTESGTGRPWMSQGDNYGASDSPVTLTGLVSGHTYTITVTPYNDAGDGPTTTRTASTP